MPSYLHELLLLLFRNSSTLAPELLQRLQVVVPEYDGGRVESADLPDIKPAAYHADLVWLLLRESQPVLGMVEIQLGVDEDKKYSWPAYVANLRARARCPVCLLVVTVENSVARWANRRIELGGGSRIVPCVVGPSTVPPITDQGAADRHVELAVLSAQAHGKDADTYLAARIASAAIVASASVDSERSRMYLDFILRSLSDGAKHMLKTMSLATFEYQSDFALECIAKGRLEGRQEGRAQIILRQLALRFGSLTNSIEARIHAMDAEQLDCLAGRVVTATTLDEALS